MSNYVQVSSPDQSLLFPIVPFPTAVEETGGDSWKYSLRASTDEHMT